MNQLAKNDAVKKNTLSTPANFRAKATSLAGTLLESWVGKQRAAEASGRIGAALSASAASAKKPQDFYDCDPTSVGTVIAIAALSGVMPSTGANALAYCIPRRDRQGERPKLRYQLSHRGLNALARRCGQTMIAIPIGYDDEISMDESGEIVIESRDIDNPPQTWEELRGIVLLVKQIDSNNVTFRGWVSKKVLESRRETSDSFGYASREGNEWAQKSDPWHKWAVEMSMKTAMHYGVARGWCVIDDSEAMRAMRADIESDLPTVEAVATVPVQSADDFKRLMETGAEVPDEAQSVEEDVPTVDVQSVPAQEVPATDGNSFFLELCKKVDGLKTRANATRLQKAIQNDDSISSEHKATLVEMCQSAWERLGKDV